MRYKSRHCSEKLNKSDACNAPRSTLNFNYRLMIGDPKLPRSLFRHMNGPNRVYFVQNIKQKPGSTENVTEGDQGWG